MFWALTFSSAFFILQGQMASLFFTRSKLKCALSVLLQNLLGLVPIVFFWYFTLLKCIGHELQNYDCVFSVQLATCCNAVKLKILMYFKAACNSWCIFFRLHYANLHYVSLLYLFINVCYCRISLYIEEICFQFYVVFLPIL